MSDTPALADRYLPSTTPVLLTGVQAIARLLTEQHAADARAGRHTATFVSGYRGSPLGGLDRTLAGMPGLRDTHDIHLVPGLNEELGATAVWGSQTPLPGQPSTRDGVVGVWYGKAPGVDRAADAIRHGNVMGAHPAGGVLVLAGDDPAAKSSTLPSAVEATLAALSVPVLFPRSSNDIVTLGRYGVALSRATGLWVGMKITADVADGTWATPAGLSDVDIRLPALTWDGRPWTYRQARAATVPWSREAEAELVGPRWQALLAFAEANPINVVEVDPAGARVGIVAAGKTYDDTVQALTDLGLDKATLHAAGIRLLRLGMVHPLAPGVVDRFAAGLAKIIVVEEKAGFLEDQLRALLYGRANPPVMVGKRDAGGRSLMPAHGALTATQIASALRRELPADLTLAPARPTRIPLPTLQSRRDAYFCSGCPHNRSTAIPEGSLAGGGIGCHTMTLRMPHTSEQMTGVTQMGGEGAQWIGQARFTETRHLFQNLGDGTYFHSGQLAVQACVAAGVNITFKLLYNSAVAMTGGQHADGSLPVPALTRKLAAEGVRRIIVCADEPGRYGRRAGFARGVEVWSRDRLDDAQRLLRDTPGVTVLIYDQQCAAEARRDRNRGAGTAKPLRVVINEDVCEGCGDCGAKSNCLSVAPVPTEFGRKTRIDQSSCNVDYSCLDGDCPAFMVAEPREERRRGAPEPPVVPAPTLTPPEGDVAVLLAGIGGTGVVTVSQILTQAATKDGLHVATLDQTGLSQKAGPVTSHLRIGPGVASNRVAGRGADCYLAFDALVGAAAEQLAHLDPDRTRSVVSISHTPTGPEVRDVRTLPADVRELTARIRAGSAEYSEVDTLTAARRLFGSTAQANLLLVGAAYQAGALPVAATAIEHAITANGVAVAANLAAFRWGRALAHDPASLPPVPRAVAKAAALTEADRRTGERLLAGSDLAGETRRLVAVRAAAIARFQNTATARRYVREVSTVCAAEGRVGTRTELSEAVARGLHRLTAYKDEYEVARLLVDPRGREAVDRELGPARKVRYRLHPPVLRALGRGRKISLSTRWTPVLRLLAAGKFLRGTPFDPFGHTSVRRLERALRDEYRDLITRLTDSLTQDNYDRAVEAAAAAELVRGYEGVKLANVRRYRERLDELGLGRSGR